MTKYIITFPGQGSQSIGMMAGLAHIPVIKKTFIEASEILNKDFWAMATSENQDINQSLIDWMENVGRTVGSNELLSIFNPFQ